MNKVIKGIVFIFIMFCTISTISLAGDNITNENGKGTVTVEDGSKQYGTTMNPYQLVLGEPIIDIYYAEEDAKDSKLTKDQYLSFEFVEGNMNAAAYMVNHNSSKRRIRFILIGTEDLRVTSTRGKGYLQAGAVTYSPDSYESTETSDVGEYGKPEGYGPEKVDIHTPFYNIVVNETFKAKLKTENETKDERSCDDYTYYQFGEWIFNINRKFLCLKRSNVSNYIHFFKI